jgi:hypothetical protein
MLDIWTNPTKANLGSFNPYFPMMICSRILFVYCLCRGEKRRPQYYISIKYYCHLNAHFTSLLACLVWRETCCPRLTNQRVSLDALTNGQFGTVRYPILSPVPYLKIKTVLASWFIYFKSANRPATFINVTVPYRKVGNLSVFVKSAKRTTNKYICFYLLFHIKTVDPFLINPTKNGSCFRPGTVRA